MKADTIEFTRRSRLLIAVITFLVLGIALKVWGATGDITLSWEYPPTEVQGVTFHVYGTNDIAIPISQWPRLASVAGPVTNATVRIQPGKFFFICTASNLWGESVPSNVASVPPTPKPPVTKIESVR